MSMSNQNEVQSWKQNFPTWPEKPNSVAGNYSTPTSPAGWTLFFSADLRHGEPLEPELPTFSVKFQQARKVWWSPNMASCIKSDKEPGIWRNRTGWHTDSLFLNILGLERTPVFQRAMMSFQLLRCLGTCRQVAKIPQLCSQTLPGWWD